MEVTGLGWKSEGAALEAITVDLACRLRNILPEGRDFHVGGGSGTPGRVYHIARMWSIAISGSLN